MACATRSYPRSNEENGGKQFSELLALEVLENWNQGQWDALDELSDSG